MIENNLKGIDEMEIFQRLWNKRIFIIVVTILCVSAGLVSIVLRSPSYLVVLDLKLKNNSNYYMNGLFQKGKIDFSHYNQTGRIEEGNMLRCSEAEKALLEHAKNDVTFEVSYPNSQITIMETTVDTVKSTEKLREVGKILQQKLTSLHEIHSITVIDSLRLVINKYREDLSGQLKEIIEQHSKLHASSDIKDRIQLKLEETEYLTSFQFKKIAQLQENIRAIQNIEVQLSTPKIKSDTAQLDIRSLLMRWIFFGFVGSSICVLGYLQIKSLLNKRKN